MTQRKIDAYLATLALAAVFLEVVGGIDSSMRRKRKPKDDHELA
jgi:hypothetical protein